MHKLAADAIAKQERERRKSLEKQALEAEKGKNAKRYKADSRSGPVSLSTDRSLEMVGANTATGKKLRKSKYKVEASKGLDSHPDLRAIANLVGQKGEDAKLTKQDFEMLSTMKGEEGERLRGLLQEYIARGKDQQIIVTIDGHVITSHITKKMAEQARLSPLGNAGPKAAVGADPALLTTGK